LKKYKVSIIFIILILIIPSNIITSKEDPNKSLLQYHQIIEIEFADSSVLNTPIPLEETRLVPIKVKYYTTIPEFLLNRIPRIIRNIILFRRIIEPIQTVKLEILNSPDYADISISKDEILFSIPREHPYEITTNVLIYLDKNAPALFPFTFAVKGSCNKIGVLQNFTTKLYLASTPDFDPCITLEYENNVNTPPSVATNIQINITNCGNGESLIRSRIITLPNDFIVTINPQIIVPVTTTKSLILSLYPGQYFSGSFLMRIELTVEFSSPGANPLPTKKYFADINLYYP